MTTKFAFACLMLAFACWAAGCASSGTAAHTAVGIITDIAYGNAWYLERSKCDKMPQEFARQACLQRLRESAVDLHAANVADRSKVESFEAYRQRRAAE